MVYMYVCIRVVYGIHVCVYKSSLWYTCMVFKKKHVGYVRFKNSLLTITSSQQVLLSLYCTLFCTLRVL